MPRHCHYYTYLRKTLAAVIEKSPPSRGRNAAKFSQKVFLPALLDSSFSPGQVGVFCEEGGRVGLDRTGLTLWLPPGPVGDSLDGRRDRAPTATTTADFPHCPLLTHSLLPFKPPLAISEALKKKKRLSCSRTSALSNH